MNLAESNCTGVAFGVESGSQDILDKIHKNISLQHVEYIVDLMNKYGVGIFTTFNTPFLGTWQSVNYTYQDFIKERG